MPSPKTRRRAAAVIAAAALGAWPLTLSFASTPTAPTSPGTFKGWAFDACAAPSAKTMDAWLKDKTNPYRGVGVYISGSLRACSQPNLTADWVSHVQQTGWHVLPLTVGPQANCTGFSRVIDANPANNFVAARKQGAAQADDAVAHARALGIVPGSTLFYDLENWHTGYNNCDASALWFMSAWTNRLHTYGYAGGTYVSGLSGARLLNAMANATPSGFVLPDQLWIAEWNNQENVKAKYVDAKNWANHQRAHQYWGGHSATNSGITLNIDSNYVDLQTVSPIPRVVPDSAIGAPLPLPAPVSTPTIALPTPTPPVKPSAPPTTKAPSPTKTPSKAPSTTPKPSPSATQSTPIAKPVTTMPTPTKAGKPTAPPKTAPTKTPQKPGKQATLKGLNGALNNVSSQLGSATGIKLPTLPEARVRAPKLADRVPTMVVTPPHGTSSRAAIAPRKVAQPRATATTSAPTAAAPQAQQAPLIQPALPNTIPTTVHEPSLITKIWNGAMGVLSTIGHALAAAAAWVGRAFGSMLGW